MRLLTNPSSLDDGGGKIVFLLSRRAVFADEPGLVPRQMLLTLSSRYFQFGSRPRTRVRVARTMPIRTGKPTCQERSARTVVWRGFGKVLVARHDAQVERPGTAPSHILRLRPNPIPCPEQSPESAPCASGDTLDPQVKDPTTVASGTLFLERSRSLNYFSTSVS